MIAFDHLAIGTGSLPDGWELFGSVLGGRWAYGSDSPGYWWGQLTFSRGPKVELLTPTGGPDAAFLERFLARHEAGPHHFNFLTTDIDDTLARVRAAGIEPVGISLDGPGWKEMFLHPRSAHGIVIQVAQQDRAPTGAPPPAGLPEPGPAAGLDLIEHHVSDLADATRLFTEVLDGVVDGRGDGPDGSFTELTWPGGARLRLTRPAGPAGDELPHGGSLHELRFRRDRGAFSAAETERAAELAKRLGVTVRLASAD